MTISDKQKTIVRCEYCGKEVKKTPSNLARSKHHFCSKQCHDEWKRQEGEKGKVRLKCNFCGKDFIVHNYRKDTAKFCSRSCLAKWKNPPKWKKVTCKFCNKEFFIKPSMPNIFCSKRCYYTYKATGAYKNTWRKTKEKICLNCGQSFIAISPINIDRAKFCSNKCSISYLNRTQTPWHKGKKGIHFAPQTEFKGGKEHPFYGKSRSDETKEKISEKAKERYKDKSKHPGWRGGLSFEPYEQEFDNNLKEKIRKMDNYICQKCGRTQEQLKRKLYIHHIDYNKKNNNMMNLISLCIKCHGETNFTRSYWSSYFKNKFGEKNGRLENAQNRTQ